VSNNHEKKNEKLQPNWIEKIHSSTLQPYWEHEITKMKRWSFPSIDDNGENNTDKDIVCKKQKIIGPIGPK